MLESKMPSFGLGRVLLVLVVLVLLAPGCTLSCSSGNTRFVRGYATYWVEFFDVVVDRFGQPQLSYCSNTLVFQGDIDTLCSSLPMVWSYGQYSSMSCVYTDTLGNPWSYTDIYYFSPGYIQEVPCQSGYPYPLEVDDTPVNGMTELDRDEEGRVVAPMDVTLAEEQEPLEALRALRNARSAMPMDLPAEPSVVRTSETTLGELADADAGGGEG